MRIIGWILITFLIISSYRSSIFHVRTYLKARQRRNLSAIEADVQKKFYEPFIVRVILLQLFKLAIAMFLIYRLMNWHIIGWILVILLILSALLGALKNIKIYLLLGSPGGVDIIFDELDSQTPPETEEEAREQGEQIADEIRYRFENLIKKLFIQAVKVGIAIYFAILLLK